MLPTESKQQFEDAVKAAAAAPRLGVKYAAEFVF
jgi:hypothetical protein